MTPDVPVREVYRLRRDKFAAAENRCAVRGQLLTHVRTIGFLLVVGLFLLGWLSGQGRLWYVAGGLAFGGFLALVAYHESLLRDELRYRVLRNINMWALARLDREWGSLPEPTIETPAEQLATANDLDLFGHASLFQFLCTANTPVGRRTLRDWLLAPASPETIQRRQRAAAELAPRLELREKLSLEGRLLADQGHATERFVEWAEGQAWLTSRTWLVGLSRLLPTALVVVWVLGGCRAVSGDLVGVATLAAFVLNFLISVLYAGRIHDVYSQLSVRSGAVRRYLRMFELMYAMPDSATELDVIKRRATESGGGVLVRMRQLNGLARLAGIQHSALLFVFVYLPLQFLFLYDFHVLSLIEAWQRRYGKFARGWFEALGEFEALCSLATLVHDHSDWVFPEVAASADRFRAERLGHPLLPDDQRVANDVEVGPAGSFLLVTGSNMSGKSTLLRAIGVNAVLAEAGAPVCAAGLIMPPVMLATSMRVRDSLEYGVSFYMAELMRLKEIVDLARQSDQRPGRTLLYLLDEILLGTNSRERHLAVVRVMQFLLQHTAIGAISTHDLELAASEPLSGACRCVHFRETLHDQAAPRPMTFDYQLRPGIATTTNALRLLELVGLADGARNADCP